MRSADSLADDVPETPASQSGDVISGDIDRAAPSGPAAARRAVDRFGISGRTVGGKYAVSEAVGDGGFGVVYRGQNQDMAVPVALKCLLVPETFSDAERGDLLGCLRREANALFRLSKKTHGVPQALDAGSFVTEGGVWVPYLVAEWLEGETLEAYLKREPKGLPPDAAVALLEPAADALALAHEDGIAHRDVKPSNLFLALDHPHGAADRAFGAGAAALKLLDFGVAKVLEEKAVFRHDRTSVTQRAAFTPAYGAPEQFEPDVYGGTGPWTDVFALGLILVELLTGRRALEGPSYFAFGLSACNIGDRLRELDLGVGPDVKAILAKALARRSEDRPSDIRAYWHELGAAVRRDQGGRGVGRDQAVQPSAEGPTEPAQAPRWPTEFPLFCAYSEHDEDLRLEMERQLFQLGIDAWCPRRVTTPWDGPAVSPDLERAKIVLVLLSPDLVASGYCDGVELRRALEMHRDGCLRVVPLLLRRVAGHSRLPFGDLVPLPRFAAPVTSWQHQRDAWLDVAESLRLILADLRGKRSSPRPRTESLVLNDVFTPAKLPRVTFVETEAYRKLCRHLRDPGPGLAIAGPSGVGKTAALRRAMDEIGRSGTSPLAAERIYLTTISPADRRKIESIDEWHERGIVAIDDFHRLEARAVRRVGDHMKYLADTESRNAKVVIVGIPGSGQSLVDHDVAARINSLRFGRTQPADVMRMIEQGEQALGVTIARKSDLAIAAAGSFNIAQFLCACVCENERVERTEALHRTITWRLEPVLRAMMGRLKRRVEVVVSRFGGLVQDDLTAVELLKELPGCEDGYLSLRMLMGAREPAFGARLRRLLGEVEKLYKRTDPDDQLHKLLFFEPREPALIVEDPQLLFYFAHVDFKDLARQAGKGAAVDRLRVVVHRSMHDETFEKALTGSLHPLAPDIDLRVAEVKSGASWLLDLEVAFEYASVAVLVVTDTYLRSFVSLADFARFLERRIAAGVLVLPVLLTDRPLYDRTPLSRFAPIVDEPGAAGRQRLWAAVADGVSKRVHPNSGRETPLDQRW